MQDRPTATELLQALAGSLYAEVSEWVPRERRFQVLVAANLAAIVDRELRAGPEPSLADVALFRSILGVEGPAPEPEAAEDEAREAATELAWAIREGKLDAEIESVAARLREHVRRKLEIARPGYAGE
jgi:Domain of unknown function (DUF6285)